LVDILDQNEFWNQGKDLLRELYRGSNPSSTTVDDCLNDWLNKEIFSSALDTLMQDLSVVDAVEKYVTKLAEIFNLQKEDETACVAELVDILDGNVSK
jgi:hypothetical protein